jgi:hypothetical protein
MNSLVFLILHLQGITGCIFSDVVDAGKLRSRRAGRYATRVNTFAIYNRIGPGFVTDVRRLIYEKYYPAHFLNQTWYIIATTGVKG